MSDTTLSPEAIAKALAAPFDPSEVRWKPGKVSGNRAMALPYIDARLVMDRLDSALGLGNWQTVYRETPIGVICSLSVRISGDWSVHEDFAGYSGQSDAGDKHKAAFSGALKRAAVHLGVGRYLYRLSPQWVDYDPQKRQFTKTPVLPEWARPKGQPKPTTVTQTAPRLALQTVPSGSALLRCKVNPPHGPAGLKEYLTELDAYLCTSGMAQAGDLEKHLRAEVKAESGASAIWPPDYQNLTPEHIRWVWATAATYAVARKDNLSRKNGQAVAS